MLNNDIDPKKHNTERHGRGCKLIKQFLPNMRYNIKGNEAKFTLPIDMNLLKKLFIEISNTVSLKQKPIRFTDLNSKTNNGDLKKDRPDTGK